jgi:hypothetical protein
MARGGHLAAGTTVSNFSTYAIYSVPPPRRGRARTIGDVRDPVEPRGEICVIR